MYCSKCHHEHHPIYKVVDDDFDGFIKNNRGLLEDMTYGEIVEILANDSVRRAGSRKVYHLGSKQMMKDPYNVKYIGKIEGGEGPLYVFLDANMDKLYSYYDVM